MFFATLVQKNLLNMKLELKQKILNLLLIITSLLGYLQWGKSNETYLYKAEYDLIIKLFSDPMSVLHPFTMLPLAGQLILLIGCLQKKPAKSLTYWGIGLLGVLLGFILVIGIMANHLKIILSVVPFWVIAIYTIQFLRKNKT